MINETRLNSLAELHEITITYHFSQSYEISLIPETG